MKNSFLSTQAQQPPNLQTKLGYGVGEMSSEVPGSVLTFFLLFFLTNVAGLNPTLAGGLRGFSSAVFLLGAIAIFSCR